MGLTCNIRGHKWDGCKCTRCGAKRDEGHRYELVGYYDFCQEVCSVCGDTRNRKEHDWIFAKKYVLSAETPEIEKSMTGNGYRKNV